MLAVRTIALLSLQANYFAKDLYLEQDLFCHDQNTCVSRLCKNIGYLIECQIERDINHSSLNLTCIDATNNDAVMKARTEVLGKVK